MSMRPFLLLSGSRDLSLFFQLCCLSIIESSEGTWSAMAMKLKHPCAHPGCPELVEGGQKYCEKHKAMHPEDMRPAYRRGYDAKWKKFRRWYLESHPFCVMCMQEKPPRYTRATIVDHIKPFRGDKTLQYDLNNLQPLCKHHHDIKTGRYDSHPEYTYPKENT